MISLSRSAVLAIAVAAVVLLIDASWRNRANLLGFGLVFVAACGVVVNGLIGTLTGMFSQASEDPSVQARLARFPRVLALVAENPLWGRGFGTYNIDEYFLLDNEIQKTVIETGFIGLTLLVVFIFFVVGVA